MLPSSIWKNIVTDMADDPLWGIQSETLSARLVAHYPHTYITHVTFMRITCSGLRHAGLIIRYLATDVNVVRILVRVEDKIVKDNETEQPCRMQNDVAICM